MKICFNLRRFIANGILFFIAAIRIFAYEGMMTGEKDLRIVRTEHFEIIFPERSRKSAEIIFARAEDVYKEVAATYGLPHDFRIPIVISASQDEFNGYFSFAPFNHIVINDTVPAEDMAVFSESLISVFRHELTHAISYNMHGDFWNGVKKSSGILTIREFCLQRLRGRKVRQSHRKAAEAKGDLMMNSVCIF